MYFQKLKKAKEEMKNLAKESYNLLKNRKTSWDFIKKQAWDKAKELSHEIEPNLKGQYEHSGEIYHEERQDLRHQLNNIFHKELKKFPRLIPSYAVLKQEIIPPRIHEYKLIMKDGTEKIVKGVSETQAIKGIPYKTIQKIVYIL